jgi:hypothetical protein
MQFVITARPGLGLNPVRIVGLACFGLMAGMSTSMLYGCDPVGEGGVPGCDLSCPTAGILEGNAAITGVAEVDAFFGAVVDLSASAKVVSGTLDAEIDAIGLSLGLPSGSDLPTIRGAVEQKFMTATEGGVTFEFKPPRCETSVDVALAAAAECDATVQPGTATAACEGSCEVEGGATASCTGDATLTCTGSRLDCTAGSCTGDCELATPGVCEGTCRGTCAGDCAVTDAQGNCAGACTNGMCTGTCELEAGGSCSGNCQGWCTIENATSCDATATARCEAGASGSVECDGRCQGEVTPPMVKTECQATVEAKADASVECFPPDIEVTWNWSVAYANDPALQSEFKAWLRGFKGHVGMMAGSGAKADILIEALADLGGERGLEAVTASGDTLANGDVVVSFKLLNCGLRELDNVAGVLNTAATDLGGSLSASVEVFSAAGITMP